jgi:hypothetical protein
MAITLAAPATEAAKPTITRPFDAPLLGGTPELPPPPPEYLGHEAEGIRFRYHPSARERVRPLFEKATLIRAELANTLGYETLESLEVRVAIGPTDFQRIMPKGAPLGTRVLAVSELGVLLMSLGGPDPLDVEPSFRHGMAHLALGEVAGSDVLPRWFHEGFAVSFSGEDSMARSRRLWWGAMRKQLAPMADLDWSLSDDADRAAVALAQAADFVRFLSEDAGHEGLPGLLREVRSRRQLDAALAAAFLADEAALQRRWREQLARRKAFAPVLTGGILLWMLVALTTLMRRRWREQRSAEQAAEQRVSPKPATVASARRAAREPKLSAKARTAKVVASVEPEVPKVSHNGRWHTLH